MTRISRAILIGSLFVTSVGPVHAQDVIELPLVVQSGDLLQVSYSHERSQGGQVSGAKISGEIRIDDVYSDSFLASWTTTSVEVAGVVIDASHPEAPGMLIGIPIQYLADSAGTPARIEDREGLLDMVTASLIANRGGESVDREALARTRALFESMNDEALASGFLTVPKYLAVCQGTALEPGVPNTAEVEVASPVSTAPVTSVVTYLLKNLDEETGMAQVEFRSTLDPESAEQAVRGLVAQIAEEIPESELQGMSLERNDVASCDVNIETGVAESITYTNETKALGEQRTETLIFSVVHSRAGSQ